jgi:hypothetical protein
MDPRPQDSPLRRPLEHQHRAHTRALVTRHALRAAARIAVAIAVAVALGALLPTGVPGAWARLALLVAVAIAVTGLTLAAFGRERRTMAGWLEEAEGAFPALRSWLRNALEVERQPPTHTSPELAGALAREAARRLDGVPLQRLRPPVRAVAPALLAGGAVVLVLVLGALWPARTERSWRTLLVPAAAAPPVRLEVEPGSVTLTPGAALGVRARVWGTIQAPQLRLGHSDAPDAVLEGPLPDGGRAWRFDLTQLTLEQDYRVRVAGHQSPLYHIRFSGDPTPVGFDVEYRPPAYSGLPVQRGAAPRGDLSALRGTHARVEVTFDRDLDALEVRLPGGAAAHWSDVTPRRWRGEITLDREGEYELAATAHATAGGAPHTARYRYRVTPLADAPPVIVVRTPSGDIDLPIGQQVPVDVFVQDDLGLSELRLESRKDPAAPWRAVPLSSFAGHPREAAVASHWDAAPLGLLPGEVGTFRFIVFDDNAVSGRGMAVSPTFELRFPSMAEMYDHVSDQQNGSQQSLEKAAEQTKEVQKTLDRLARQQAARSSAETPQSVQRSEELKSAAEKQGQIGQQIEEATKQLQESVAQASERQAFDQQLMRKLNELNQLMQQIQSPELRDALQKMQEALAQMDRQRMEQTLPDLKRQNQQMLENLQRSIELLKQLREEERLQALAARAQELKAQQDQLNREHAGEKPRDGEQRKSESEQRAAKQEEAAKASEQLAKDVRQRPDSASASSPQDPALQKAAEMLEQQAATEQRAASKQASQGQDQQAQQSGQKASESLQEAADQITQAVQQMQTQQSDVDLAAVRRAAQDLVSLQRQTEQTLASDQPPAQQADRQSDLSEGASRVSDSLLALAKRSPFLSNDLVESLGHAINSLQQSSRDYASGNRARGEESGRNGAASLNQAVLELRASEDAMCNKPGRGKPGATGQKPSMGQVSQRQGQLNQESRSLSERLSKQMRLSAGDQGEMQRLSQEQARIREQVEEIQKDEEQRHQMLGRLDQVQHDMKDVEEILASGQPSGELEEKQNRILSRLLDAQRSVNRRDFEPERESRPGVDVERASPAQLDPALLRDQDRLRLDLLKAANDRYPARYRSFVEAYLRSLNGSPR